MPLNSFHETNFIPTKEIRPERRCHARPAQQQASRAGRVEGCRPARSRPAHATTSPHAMLAVERLGAQAVRRAALQVERCTSGLHVRGCTSGLHVRLAESTSVTTRCSHHKQAGGRPSREMWHRRTRSPSPSPSPSPRPAPSRPCSSILQYCSTSTAGAGSDSKLQAAQAAADEQANLIRASFYLTAPPPPPLPPGRARASYHWSRSAVQRCSGAAVQVLMGRRGKVTHCSTNHEEECVRV